MMSSERARGHTSGHLDREHASMVVYDIVQAVRDHTWSIEHALDALEACVVPDPRLARIEALCDEWAGSTRSRITPDFAAREVRVILRGDQ